VCVFFRCLCWWAVTGFRFGRFLFWVLLALWGLGVYAGGCWGARVCFVVSGVGQGWGFCFFGVIGCRACLALGFCFIGAGGAGAVFSPAMVLLCPMGLFRLFVWSLDSVWLCSVWFWSGVSRPALRPRPQVAGRGTAAGTAQCSKLDSGS